MDTPPTSEQQDTAESVASSANDGGQPNGGDTLSVDQVRDALRQVIDPELGADIVSLGMVGDIAIDADLVTIGVKLTIKGCPLRSQIESDVTNVVERHPSVTRAIVRFAEMNDDERAAVMERARRSAQERAPRPQLPPSCQVIAIGSGKGGVGKSSVTVNLAIALARAGATVGLLDADIWGFSTPRMLGMDAPLEAQPGPGGRRPLITPNSKTVGDGELKVVSTGFLVEETTALMWRGLMLNKAVEQFLLDVDWGDLDYLLLDLPPGTGDVQMGIARMLPDARMIVVTTPALAAQQVAQRAADMARRSFLEVAGVIENMSGFRCEHGELYHLFGEGGGAALADAIGVPLLAQIPIEPDISAGNDAGEPVALGDLPASAEFRDLADAVSEMWGTDDQAPAFDAEGCSARMLAAVEAAFEAATE